MTSTHERPRHGRTNPAPIAILTAILLLGVYYVLVVASGTLRGTTEVPVAGQKTLHGDYVTLVMTVQEVDVTGRQVQATVLPVADGRAIREKLSTLPVDFAYKEYNMAHEVSNESLGDIAAWLRARLS